MEEITKSAQETKELGKRLATSLKGGEVLALVGDLGAGKTTFVQGLAQGLGIKSRIISPTFILMRNYQGKKNLYHIDLYRLEENIENEVKNLGIEEIWDKPQNIVVIEWAEKLPKSFYPLNTTWIGFKNIGEEERKIVAGNYEVLEK